MNNVNERIAAIVAMRPLEADADFHHPAATLRRNFSTETIRAIREAEKEARQFNKDMKEAMLALLSVDAQQYWADTQKLIMRGKMAQADGNQAWVDRVNRDSEGLEETFDERVPDADKPKFKMLDPQRHAETWDPLWAYIEYPAPLLREEFRGRTVIPNVSNHAQLQVLRDIAREDVIQTAEEQEAARQSAIRLRRLAFALHDDRRTERDLKIAKENEKAYLRTLDEKEKKKRLKKIAQQNEAMGLKKVEPGAVVDALFESLTGKPAADPDSGVYGDGTVW